MKKGSKDNSFIKKPSYPGGMTAMKAFIGKHLKYPKEALKNKIEGTIHVNYIVNHKGKVIDAKNISHLGHGCDEEAIRVVKLLAFLVPDNPRRMKIQFNQKIRIHFNLPKKTIETPVKAKSEFSYSTVSALNRPQKKDTKQNKKPPYTYTISW